jgi:hypothetical protein
MSVPFTVTHPIGRVPTFSELQPEANEYQVQIIGSDQKGEFKHPLAAGNYAFEKNGELHGDFTGQHVLGIITGGFTFWTGKAEVTVTKKPFFMPEGALKAEMLERLKVFCAKFPPAG